MAETYVTVDSADLSQDGSDNPLLKQDGSDEEVLPPKQKQCLRNVFAGSCCCVLSFLAVVFLCGIPLANVFVKHAIGHWGTLALGTKTSAESVSLGVWGESTVTGISAADLYSVGGTFLRVGQIGVGADYWSFLADVIHVDEVDMGNVSMAINQGPGGKINVNQFVKHIQNFTRMREAMMSIDQKQFRKMAAEYMVKKKITVDRLSLTNVNFSVNIPLLTGKQGAVPFAIDNIMIVDIGKKNNGITLVEFVAIVVQALLRSFLHTIPNQFRNLLLHRLLEGVEQVLDYGALHANVGQGLVKIGNTMGGAMQRLGNRIENSGDKISGAIDKAANKTEHAFTDPLEKLLAPKLEKQWHSNVKKSLKVFHKFADRIENFTQHASNAVNGAADKTTGAVVGAGQTMSTASFAGTLTAKAPPA